MGSVPNAHAVFQVGVGIELHRSLAPDENIRRHLFFGSSKCHLIISSQRGQGQSSTGSLIHAPGVEAGLLITATEKKGGRRRATRNAVRSLQFRLRGGGRGIRTPGTVSRTSVFKTDCFNHSHIPPLFMRASDFP